MACVAASACGVGGYQPWWDGDKGIGATSGGDDGGDAGDVGDAPGAPDGGAEGDPPGHDGGSAPGPPLHDVMFVLMAYQSWGSIEGSTSAPYINGTLLPMGAHAEAYFAAAGQTGESEPNVVWLEAGDDFGITDNGSPARNLQATQQHLVDQLEAAGVSWKAYVEHIAPGTCPIVDRYPFRTWHVPFLFFDDVVGSPPSSSAPRCLQHVAPFTQLATDLQNGTMPRYAFIVPDFCDDMHDDCNTGDPIRQGDDWLAAHVPPLLASQAYADGGVVFVAWDFSPDGNVPIGLIALSARARAGYASQAMLDTSSTLRSLQEIFGVGPLLGGAAAATDVGDLFTSFP